jgi:hypothetical protein
LPRADDAIEHDSLSLSGLSRARRDPCKGAFVRNDADPGPGMVDRWW